MLPTNYSFTNHIDLIYKYKQDLAVYDRQRLTCRKTQSTTVRLLFVHLLNMHGRHRSVVANMQDCDIVVGKLELQLHSYVHFRTNILAKSMNLLIPAC